MFFRYIWFFFIVGKLSSTGSSAERIGSLEVRINYKNPLGLVPGGYFCDHLTSLCDVYFKICLTEEDSPISCNIFDQTTDPVKAESVNHYFEAHYSTNKELNLSIEVFDYDYFSAPDKLGQFLYSFRPSSAHTLRILKEVDRVDAHKSTNMYVEVQSKCGFKRYGPECNFCDVPDDRGHCDPNGFPVCLAGFHGPNCSLFDGCRNLKCAPFATCSQVGDSFVCICDGTSGERCESGYDPCEEHICEHNGTCASIGEHLNFAKCVNCSPGWDGLYCERKLNACELETMKLGHPPCINGGHCVVKPANETQFICLCAPGWQGPRCATSSSKACAIVTVISLIILVALLACTVASVYCFRFCILPKLSQKQKGTELADGSAKTNNNSSQVYDFYEVPRDHVTSTCAAHSRIREKDITLITAGSQRSSVDNYEYETMSDEEQKPYPATAEPRLTVEEVSREPIRSNLQSALKTQAIAALNSLIADDGSIETPKRPLPMTPSEGEDYEPHGEN